MFEVDNTIVYILCHKIHSRVISFIQASRSIRNISEIIALYIFVSLNGLHTCVCLRFKLTGDIIMNVVLMKYFLKIIFKFLVRMLRRNLEEIFHGYIDCLFHKKHGLNPEKHPLPLQI